MLDGTVGSPVTSAKRAGQHWGLQEGVPQHAKGLCPPPSLLDIGQDSCHPTHGTFREAKAGMLPPNVG